MKQACIVVLLLTGMAGVVMAASVEAPSRPSSETVSFAVFSNGFKVGSGSLSFDGAVLRLDIKAAGMQDKETVKGSVEGARPILVERDVKVFGRKEIIREEYAQDGKSVRIVKSVGGQPAAPVTIRSDKPLQNVLLAITQLRQDRDLAIGRAVALNLPTQSFRLVVKSKKKIRVPLGTREAFYIESEPKKYRIWLGTDPRHIPLRIQGVVPAGMVYLAASDINPK